MTSWHAQRAAFQNRIDALNLQNIDALLSDLNNSVATYVQTAGLTADPTANPTYTHIQNIITQITAIKNNYVTLQNDITNYLATNAQQLDLSGTLQENGQIQKELRRIEKTHKKLDNDVETALARDELLRSRNKERNAHSLFLMDRPLKKQTIPILWVFSVAFIGIALIIVKIMMADVVLPTETIELLYTTVLGFILNPIILASLLGAAIIVIIFLSLKIGGVI